MIEKTRLGSKQLYPPVQVYSIYNAGECMMDEAIAGQGGVIPEITEMWTTSVANKSVIRYENGGIFNPCDHTYDKLTLSPECWSQRHGYCSRRSSTGEIFSSGWRGVPQPEYPTAPPSYVVTEEMRKRAWAKIYPEINDGLNLAVSLFEFRDVARLVKSLQSLAKLLDTQLRDLSKSPRDHLTKLGEYFLAYQFGIKPIVRDFLGIAERLIDLKKTLADFKALGKIPRNYHYREELGSSLSKSLSSHGYIYTRHTATYNATCRMIFDYEVPEFFEGLLRVGGLRVNAATVWETIPWSFAIDWIVKVQDFLEQFDRDPRITLHVIAYCDTIKSVNQKAYTRSDDSDCFVPVWPSMADTTLAHEGLNPVTDDSRPLWVWKRTQYNRVPGIPNTGYALPVFDGSLSNTQLVLGGALWLQQTRS